MHVRHVVSCIAAHVRLFIGVFFGGGCNYFNSENPHMSERAESSILFLFLCIDARVRERDRKRESEKGGRGGEKKVVHIL